MRVEFLGVPVDLLSLDETVERALDAMRSRGRIQHVALNVAKLVKASSDPQLMEDLERSDIIGIDGVGILLGLKLAGIRHKGRVNGTDLMMRLLEACAREGFRPFFLGATATVVAEAADRARRQFPGLDFAGIRDGYYTAEEEQGVVDLIQSSGADCLFVGMPTPRKERFLLRHREALAIPFIMGVGGSFDVLAGSVRRAPLWMQRGGLEWAYRVMQEPGRMWWRYLSTNTVYAGLLASVVVKRLRNGSTRRTDSGPGSAR